MIASSNGSNLPAKVFPDQGTAASDATQNEEEFKFRKLLSRRLFVKAVKNLRPPLD
jgi:hypothetical protein